MITQDKQYIVTSNGKTYRFSSDDWAARRDRFMELNPEADIAEVDRYSVDDTQDGDTIVARVDGKTYSFDKADWDNRGQSFMEKYSTADLSRVRGVDYYYDQAIATEGALEEAKKEKEAWAANRKTGMSSASLADMKMLEAGLTPISRMDDNNMAAAQAYLDEGKAIDEKIAALQEQYDNNPRVKAAKEAWEKQNIDYTQSLLDEVSAKKKQYETADVAGETLHRQAMLMGSDSDLSYITGTNKPAVTTDKLSYDKLGAAENFLEKAKQIRTGEATTFWSGFGNPYEEDIKSKMYQSDAKSYTEVALLLKRLNDEVGSLNDLSAEDIDKHLNEEDKYLLKAFLEYSDAEASGKKGWKYTAGEIGGESLKFALEFMATSGISGGIAKSITKGLQLGLKRWAKKAAVGTARRVARNIATKAVDLATRGALKAAIMTMTRPSTYTTIAKALPTIDEEGNVKLGKNAAEGAYDAFAESVSELSGGAISKILGIPFKWVKNTSAAKAFSRSFGSTKFGAWGKKIWQGSFGNYAKAAGFEGAPIEVLEEYVGNAMRLPINPNAIKEMHEGDNFASMLLGFVPMTVLGGGISAASLGFATRRARQSASALRDMLINKGFADSKVSFITDINREHSPVELGVEVYNLKKELERRGATQEELQLLGDYSVALAEYQTVRGGMDAMKAQEKSDVLKEIEAQYQGTKIFQTNAEGNETVTWGETNDGKQVFITSERTPNGEYAAVDRLTGKTMFVSEQEIKESQTSSLDAYLEHVLMGKRQVADVERMLQERQEQINELSDLLPSKLNLGTEGTPKMVAVKSKDGKGVTVVDEQGDEAVLSWDIVAQKLGTPIESKTSEEITEAEIEALSLSRAEKKASIAKTKEQMDAAEKAIADTNAEIKELTPNPEEEYRDPNTGEIDQDAFWEHNPEGWADYNDRVMNDGGIDTMEQIENGLAKLNKQKAELDKMAIDSPNARKAVKAKRVELQEKIDRLTALQQKYNEMFAAAEQEAIPEEERVAENTIAMREVIEGWRNQYGVPIHVYESKAEVADAGEFAARAQIEVAETPGWSNSKGVHLFLPDIKSMDKLRETLQHELIAHQGFKLLGEKEYNALMDKIWAIMSDSAKTTFYNYPSAVSSKNLDERRRKAAEEFAAHVAEKIDLGEATAEQKSIWQRIMEFFRNLFKGQEVDSQLIANAIRQNHESLKQRAAQENVQEFKAEAQEQAENNAAAPEVMDDGTNMWSTKTYRDGGRTYLDMWLQQDENISEQERQYILDTMDFMYNAAEGLKEKYEAFGAWSEADVVTDAKGDPIMSVIKANGDYSMNLDFSLVCKKRRALNALLNKMIKDGRFDGMVLREKEIARINQILQKHGFEVACALCFVDAKRYRVASVATQFTSMYNDLVKSLIPKNSGYEALWYNYMQEPNQKEEDARKNPETVISNLPDESLDWTRIDKILKRAENKKQLNVEEKIAKLLKSGAEYRKLASSSDFISDEGFELVTKNNPELLKLYNAKKGTGGPKASLGDVQYMNNILKSQSFTPEKAYKVGGVRVQSFSDYMPHMFFDYMQMMAELAAKRLPAHAYTKEPAFAKLFGMTGMKINLSLVPRVDMDGIAPGLDAEGNYTWAVEYVDEEGKTIATQTFPPEVAFEMQEDPRYSGNVGAIAVGISDEHILKMLNDPNIHFVIPYHKSSLNPDVAKMAKIDQYSDYTNYQTEKLDPSHPNAPKGKLTAAQKKAEIAKRAFDFYGSLAQTNDPKQTAADYLSHCKEVGLIPKFPQFANNENYYKLLVDFNTYDFVTGEYAPQGAVTMTFPDNMLELIEEGLVEDQQLDDKLNAEISEVAEEVYEELGTNMYKSTRKSLNTVLPGDETPFKGTVVSSDSVANILKEIDSAIEKYQNINNDTRGFVSNIAKTLGLTQAGPSNYATFTAINGTVFTLRMSDHNATVSNFDNVGENYGISIVVSRKPNTGLINDGKAGVAEFFYSDKKLNKAEGKPLVEIIKSIKQMFYSGQYKDTTGLAETESANLFKTRTDSQREKLFDAAKAQFGLTNNFNGAGYMLPDGSLLDFSEANDGGNPNQRSLDHREIEGIIMDEGTEYDSRWMYLADFMNEGAIRLLPEYAGINLMKAPTKEQRQRLMDFIYKYNGEVILEIADDRLNNVAYVEYDRRTSPARIFRDIDGYFNEGIVPKSNTMFKTSAANNKSPEFSLPNELFLDDRIMFKVSRNNRQTISSWLNKRPDLNDEAKAEVLDYLDQFSDATLQLAVGKWYAQNAIKLPEDIEKCMQAVASAKKAKIDALKFASPMEIINEYGVIEPKAKPINPDKVSTLSKVRDLSNGISIYDVEDSEESRKNMREIINTHYGKNCSPWCILQGDENGKLTAKSQEFWRHYNGYPKQVAFKDGKLLAFSANDSEETAWWDRMDKSYSGVPVNQKIGKDKLGRTRTVEFDQETGREIKVHGIKKVVSKDGISREWIWRSEKEDDIVRYGMFDGNGNTIEGFDKGSWNLPDFLVGLVPKNKLRYIKTYDGRSMIFNLFGGLIKYDSDHISFVERFADADITGVWVNGNVYKFRRNGKLLGFSDANNSYGGKDAASFQEQANEVWKQVQDIRKNAKSIANEMLDSMEYDPIMFSTKAPYESAKAFAQGVVDEFNAKYKRTVPTAVVYANSRPMVAEGLGIPVDELTDELFKEIRQEAKSAGGANVLVARNNQDGSPITEERILIFAKDQHNKSAMIDGAMFHENIHGMVRSNPELLDLGKWLFENREGMRAKIANAIEAAYPEEKHHEEMLAGYMGYMMSVGRAQEVLDMLPEEYKPLASQIYEEFGYIPEQEDSRRSDEYRRDNARLNAERDAIQQAQDQHQGEQGRNERGDNGEDVNLFKTEITPEVRREMDTISAQAIVNGTYLKAPNGKDTNLTPEQWALVRTKNFKQWFGDWEVAANIKRGLSALRQLANGAETVRNAMRREELVGLGGTAGIEFSWGKEGKLDSNGYIRKGSGFAKILQKHGTEDALRIVGTIATGEIQEPYGPDNAKRVDIVSGEYQTTISLFKDGVSGSWVLTGFKIDPSTDAKGRGSDLSNATQDFPIHTREDLGAALESEANIQYFDELTKDISKVVDENGEPMVMHHGSAWEPLMEPKGKAVFRMNDGLLGKGAYFSNVLAEATLYAEIATGLDTTEEGNYELLQDKYVTDYFLNVRNEEDIYREGDDMVVVAKSPNQIKSATDNTGEFSEDADIRFKTETREEAKLLLQKMQGNAELLVPRQLTKELWDNEIEGKVFDTPIGKVKFGPNQYDKNLNKGRAKEFGMLLPTILRPDLIYEEYYPEDGAERQTKYVFVKTFYDENGEKHINYASVTVLKEGLEVVESSHRLRDNQMLNKIEKEHLLWNRFASDSTSSAPGSSTDQNNALDKDTNKSDTNNNSEENLFKTYGKPTEAVVDDGLRLSVEDFTKLASDIYTALPVEVRRQVVQDASRIGYDLKKATFQTVAKLAEKKRMSDDEIAVAKIVADKVEKSILANGEEMTRPLTVNEALWMVYRASNPTSRYDLIGAARNSVVADNLGQLPKQKAESKRAKDDIMFKTEYVPEQAASAAEAYEKAVSYWGNRINESFVDQYDSVDHLMRAIEEATGKPAESSEDIRLALYQSASRGLAKLKEVERDLIQNMWDAVNALAKEGVSHETLSRYVILKHGLERNDIFAARDARKEYESELRDKLRRINNDSSLTEQEKEEKMDEAMQEYKDHLKDIDEKVDEKYLENRKTDYSGIKAMFADYPDLKSEDQYSTNEEYKTARRLARRLRYKNLDKAEAEAQRECDAFEMNNGDLVKNLWDSVNNLTRGTLNMQQDYGMLSQESYDSLTNMFNYYVPLRGFADNTGEDLYDYYGHNVSDGYAPAIMGAKGRRSEAESPFGWMAAMAATAVISGEKNLVKQALYNFAVNRPNDILKVSDVWYLQNPTDGKFYPEYPPKRDSSKTPAENAEAYLAWENKMEELAKQGKAVKRSNNLHVAEVVNFGKKDIPEHVIRLNVGGMEKHLIINGHPRAAQAINGLLNVETDPDYQKGFGRMLRWMSQVSTSWNPEFWITNIMRDSITAFLSTAIEEDKEYRRAFRKNWGKAWKVIKLLPQLENGTLGNGKIEDLLREAVANGVQTGYSHIKSMEEWDKQMDKYLKDLNKEESKVIHAMKTGLHAVQQFSEAMELVSRFATYMTSREMGRDIPRSVSDAKEVTVNFNRKGSGKKITIEEAKKLRWKSGNPIFSEKWTGFKRLMGLASVAYVSGISFMAPYGRRALLFFNAAIQGLNKWVRSIRKGHGGKVALTAGAVVLLGFLKAVLQGMLDGDDDYQQNVSEYERRKNLMLGARGWFLKIALPQEIATFYGLGDMLYNWVSGNYHHKGIWEKIKMPFEQLFDMLPINPFGGWEEFLPSYSRAAIEAGFATPWEDYWGTGSNFAGMPLRKDMPWLTDAEKESLPKYTFAGEGTWEWLVSLSELVNDITGGTEVEKGWWQIDPARWQSWISQLSGGLGTFVGKVVNTGKYLVNHDEGDYWKISQTPFLSRILTATDERLTESLTNEQFYHYKGIAEASEMRWQKYSVAGNESARTKEEGSDEYKILQIYNESFRGNEENFAYQLKTARDENEEFSIRLQMYNNRKLFVERLEKEGLI